MTNENKNFTQIPNCVQEIADEVAKILAASLAKPEMIAKILAASQAKPEVNAKPSAEQEKQRPCEFGRKYREHFGISTSASPKLYNREYNYYRYHHGKCRWEK